MPNDRASNAEWCAPYAESLCLQCRTIVPRMPSHSLAGSGGRDLGARVTRTMAPSALALDGSRVKSLRKPVETSTASAALRWRLKNRNSWMLLPANSCSRLTVIGMGALCVLQ